MGAIITNVGAHTGHILIITLEPYIGLINFQLVLNAAYSCPSSIDCMHWSLKLSLIQYQRQKMQDKDQHSAETIDATSRYYHCT